MDKQLMYAATSGNYSQSVKAKALRDPSILLGTTPSGSNCIHIASIHGHYQFCRHVLTIADSILAEPDFVSLLSNINSQRERQTPLLIAAAHGHAFLALLLLECCTSPGLRQAILQQDNKGFNALHHAIRNGNIDLVLKLINEEPELSKAVTEYHESPMFISVMRDFTLVSLKLLEIPDSAHGGNHGRHALHAAARNGNQAITEKIMEKRPHLATEADKDGITPIRMAVSYNKVDVVRVFLEHDSSLGYEIDNHGYPLLCSAAQRGQVDAARELLNYCPDALPSLCLPNISIGGTTCLHIAVRNGHPEFVEFIMGTPQLQNIINIHDEEGKTALHHAVKLCDPRVVAALLSHKTIDTAVLDNNGRTAASQLSDITDDDKTLDWKEVHVLMLKADPKDDDISLYNLRKGAKQQETIESRRQRISQTQKTTSNISLIAILLATITFTAAFTLPGGYSNDTGSMGLPIMSRKAAFQAFLVSDTLAMCSSFLVTFICLMGRWEDDKFTTYYISVTKKLTWFAFVTTSTAFSTGLYTVLATQLNWLGIGICVLVALLPILTMFIAKWPVLKLKIRLSQTWRNLKLKYQPLRRTWHGLMLKVGLCLGCNSKSRDIV